MKQKDAEIYQETKADQDSPTEIGKNERSRKRQEALERWARRCYDEDRD